MLPKITKQKKNGAPWSEQGYIGTVEGGVVDPRKVLPFSNNLKVAAYNPWSLSLRYIDLINSYPNM